MLGEPLNATEGITGSKDTIKDTKDTSISVVTCLHRGFSGSGRSCGQGQYAIQINVDAGSAHHDLLQHCSMQALLPKLACDVNYTA